VEALYRAHAGRLVRYVRRLMRDWGLSDALVDAEGVVNEVFLEMIQLIRTSHSHILNPTAWLFVVARRQVSRAVQRRHTIADRDPADYLTGASSRWTSLTTRPTPNDLRGTHIALKAIADLPDRQKVAFYLRKIEGWTLAEIGEYLDCAASTAGVHVHRGNERIRASLAKNWAPSISYAGHPRDAGHDHAGHDHAGYDHAGHDHAGHLDAGYAQPEVQPQHGGHPVPPDGQPSHGHYPSWPSTRMRLLGYAVRVPGRTASRHPFALAIVGVIVTVLGGIAYWLLPSWIADGFLIGTLTVGMAAGGYAWGTLITNRRAGKDPWSLDRRFPQRS
jgi:RNA polymerase sigma factor (sigma-70 family)